MSEFYCSGCSKWAASPHYCPGRDIEGKTAAFTCGSDEEHQRSNLLRRKCELEKELKEINLRLGGVE
ncbi:hypothetical protein [Marinobacter salarius]|jgi:hypothetical protein|uniref:hypothetical protein n=1 Tax=Marinobacter salarius TaxID=1420917 RepID=UPI00145ADB61|nr:MULTISPECIES: hypothetical protein [Marinobacter]MBJ7302096.1 hypothetical protein [Marinobacter salarius]HIO30784.1 hypothetical protein [Marinobacter salarius]HIP01717.1 hypothetical protein [Marinobacter salarius]